MRYSNIDALHDSSVRSRAAEAQGAPELEPVVVRDRARRDRHEARQARFRREDVVVRAVEPAVGHAESDREQLPLAAEQKAELDLLDQVVREHAETLRPIDQLLRVPRAIARAPL